MMLRTHLALIVAVILLFLPHVSSNLVGKLLFVFIALIAAMLPDIDTGFSTIGRMRGFRFLQFFVRHRGFLHSFTFCIIVSIAFAIFLPFAALPFFLGYVVHLFLDSFTIDGIMPFWPWKKTSKWRLKTGSLFETSMFLLLILLDIFLVIIIFGKIF